MGKKTLGEITNNPMSSNFKECIDLTEIGVSWKCWFTGKKAQVVYEMIFSELEWDDLKGIIQ